MKTDNPSEKIHRRGLLAVVGSALVTGCVQNSDGTNPDTQPGDLDDNGSSLQQRDNNGSDTREEDNNGSDAQDDNDTQEDNETTEEEPEPGETVVREEQKADSPYGDEITPRELTVATERHNRSDVEIRVRDLEEETEIYYLDISLHSGGYEGIEVGKPGDYRIEAVVDGEEYEETWVVGRGFTDASVVLSDEGVSVGMGRHNGTVYVTRVLSLPPGVEPTPYEEAEELKPVAEAFERVDECDRDDSHDYCLFPPESAWEEMGDPREHTTAKFRVEGRDYGDVLNFMTAEERESADVLPDEAEELGYRNGHYVEREGEYYAFVLSGGLSPSQRGGPIW